MEKCLLVIALIALGINSNAQIDDKKVKLGIQAIGALQWFKIDQGKKIESNGPVLKGGMGLNADFKLTEVIWFNTGANFFYDGGKVVYNDTVKYFLNTDEDRFITNTAGKAQLAAGDTSKLAVYKLNSRKYNSSNLQIPLFIRLRTKEFNKFRIFGQFGINANIRLRAKAVDNLQRQINENPSAFSATEEVKSNLDITKDINIVNLGLGVGAGVEYNISGSTNLFAVVNFVNLGFTNFANPSSDRIFTTDNSNNKSGNYLNLTQKFQSRGVTLTVGVSF